MNPMLRASFAQFKWQCKEPQNYRWVPRKGEQKRFSILQNKASLKVPSWNKDKKSATVLEGKKKAKLLCILATKEATWGPPTQFYLDTALFQFCGADTFGQSN